MYISMYKFLGYFKLLSVLSIESGQPVEQLLGCASNGLLNTVTARAGTEPLVMVFGGG